MFQNNFYIVQLFLQVIFYSDDFRITTYYTGINSLALNLLGDSLAIFVNNRAQYQLGCQSMMIIGSGLMFLQVTNIHLYSFETDQYYEGTFYLVWLYVTSFFGGLGYQMCWQGGANYCLNIYNSANIYPKQKAYQYLVHLDNIGLVLAFVIIGSASTTQDYITYPHLVDTFMIVSMASFALILSLPRPGYETQRQIKDHLGPSVFITEIMKLKWIYFIPVMLVKAIVKSFCYCMAILYLSEGVVSNKDQPLQFLLYCCSMYGVGKALRSITIQYKVFFANPCRFIFGSLCMLGLLTAALVLLVEYEQAIYDYYEDQSRDYWCNICYAIMLFLGISMHATHGLLQSLIARVEFNQDLTDSIDALTTLFMVPFCYFQALAYHGRDSFRLYLIFTFVFCQVVVLLQFYCYRAVLIQRQYDYGSIYF
ncbi:UNKNOWN [Stylonychia lemnae]|uniref:Uncharacterized protein n=1 Tax=Stylonychia lemnae TaxID=5949 RepID=A0A078AI71_STYLE|nr:UNKNOWN [Stylonychia lemnae]|eukprot:CDW80503.1 UNKNOWN [Stylonychia lemnae]